MSQLYFDCLSEIFEYLEDDKFTLHSCILVNRLWCKASVRIFWRDVCYYSSSNFKTLIACLPNESKEILYKNGINISTSTSKPPTFNYASFCKVLSVEQVYYKIINLLQSPSHKCKGHIVTREIIQMFMKEILSLKSLVFSPYHNITFKLFHESKDCLKNLSDLRCGSNISTDLFYQLSQICYNIHTFTLEVGRIVSNGLADLISVQRNLKCFNMLLCYYQRDNNLTNIIPSLMLKLPNTLVKLVLFVRGCCISLSFIANFLNLQELSLLFKYDNFIDFEKLQYVIFPQLQVLNISEEHPRVELLMKFLENNGKNLKEIYIGSCSDNLLNLVIAKSCPRLRKLFIGIKYNELETLKIIFNNCKNLERIKIRCGKNYLSEKDALKAVAKYSQNIHELTLYYQSRIQFELLPEELESFFISWTNRISQKSLSLIIVKRYRANSLDTYNENVKIINKYIKLGVIKKFKVEVDEYI
ncbi:hypothetical protein RclHR1_13450003 [Rhizophagus clarus]|uniref:F-box domain-containing protein n=1 Tax=Rhizophagus clarus TaxID=94130 RepID=A0A2Z6QA03_9GLOM|nr:hypothetical protein RclHR1_13450003 [Rhizophagus clarus]GET00407.1 hypothetical protein GLOIN_2v1784405 [Rhizophagus clarus]